MKKLWTFCEHVKAYESHIKEAEAESQIHVIRVEFVERLQW